MHQRLPLGSGKAIVVGQQVGLPHGHYRKRRNGQNREPLHPFAQGVGRHPGVVETAPVVHAPVLVDFGERGLYGLVAFLLQLGHFGNQRLALVQP